MLGEAKRISLAGAQALYTYGTAVPRLTEQNMCIEVHWSKAQTLIKSVNREREALYLCCFLMIILAIGIRISALRSD